MTKTHTTLALAIATILLMTPIFAGTSNQQAFGVGTIDFEDLPGNTIVSTQYQNDGAHFSSANYQTKILDDSGETPGGSKILVSNIGANNGDIIISIVDPTTGNPSDASSIQFNLFSIGNNAVTVEAKNFNGDVLDTQIYQHNNVGGPNCNYPQWPSGCPGPITNGWAQNDFYSFSGDIRTVTVTSSQQVPGDGYGIDNVLIEFAPPNEAPDCSSVTASQELLWPPNHKFVPISIIGVTDGDDDSIAITIDGITQDEEVDAKGNGDGNTSPDGQGIGSDTAQVRAERAGTGDGRVYEISFTADDGNGGTCEGSVTVGVPHDKKDTPVDSGQYFDSTAE